MTKGPWYIMDGSTTAATDDLVDLNKRHFSVYANSFGMHVHHVANGIGEADARLIAEAPELYHLGVWAYGLLVRYVQGDAYEDDLTALGELLDRIEAQ